MIGFEGFHDKDQFSLSSKVVSGSLCQPISKP